MLQAYDLRVEYRKNPLGMDETSPRFSYKLSGSSSSQSAYRILVRRSECGEVLWDSGFIPSGESVQIVYRGAPLQPHTRYDWAVSVRDEEGVEGPWSCEEAFFETGFLGRHWKASWITGSSELVWNRRPPQRLAREFTLGERVRKARLRITALGLYEAYINGEGVSANCFTPGWTDYFNRVQYQVYDVTRLLKGGLNNLSVLLGDGWFCGSIARNWEGGAPTYGKHPALKAELAVEMENGESFLLVTDREWSVLPDGPVRMSDIYMGESYDASVDNTAWKQPGFLNSGAVRCGRAVEESHPSVRMDWQSGADIRRVMELKPRKITRRPSSGVYLVDFGQNLTGRERFCVKNSDPGACIVIRHGEMLREDGSLYTENLRNALATTTYFCGGKESESYEPVFTFYGFRYLEISGWPGELSADSISAQVICSDLEKTGDFSCSDPLLNQLYSNIVWGQRGNFLDVPTDCPQRDERLGWTGDTQVFANIATYNMYAPAFYTKWITDLNLCLIKGNGCFAHFAPNPYPREGRLPATGWSDAGLICPKVLFDKYGDTRLLSLYYQHMAHYLDWQISHSGGSYIVSNACYGDWLNMDAPTPEHFISSAYLCGMLSLLSELAGLIGLGMEAERRSRMAAEAKAAFAKEFFLPDGTICVRTQTAALLAFHFDLVPEHARTQTAAFLVDDIRNARDLHLSTGFLGTPLLLPVLTKIGEVDLAYELLLQKSFPGWLYPVTQGATTMWERWNSWSDKDGFGDVGMNSFNHYAYGAVGEWFFESICGISPAEKRSLGNRAFKRFRLAPCPGNALASAGAEFESPYGKIVSKWRRGDGNSLHWEFTVPCNTVAEIVFPGKVRTNPEELKGIRIAEGKIEALPGTYEFDLTL